MLKFVVRTCHLVAILSESVIYEEVGYKAIPIKEARETMHASLVYVKGMYRYSAGVIPVSRLKNLEKNEGLGKFKDSAICQTGRSLYFSCSLACWMMWR